MINVGPTILSNLYLVKRSFESARKTGFRYIVSIIIIGILFLECVFLQLYLQRLIQVMEQEIMSADLKSAQLSLNGNQFLIIQISFGRDILSFLIVIISIYILFDFRNKMSLIKAIDRIDVETKIYLGIHPKYVLREFLLKNFFIYMLGLSLSYVLSILLNMKLVSLFNSILPYDIQVNHRNSIFLSIGLFILMISIVLAFYIIVLEFISIQRFKRTFSLY
ncbi:hypothetical protein [Candidatus Enterococcus mangumiae]|uniref:ABC3 transporter permease protein domain-containing protein n=1 Tax=Candidatus Enterococcus mangumiae TaxID=2230878 RepID=A0ABZ2SUB2_9ENTE|nr:hypothetical protein [Enterococcus sp. DIV1094]MBO0488924.1 hypothetical protein [Enterococcus sp. DIV1094]